MFCPQNYFKGLSKYKIIYYPNIHFNFRAYVKICVVVDIKHGFFFNVYFYSLTLKFFSEIINSLISRKTKNQNIRMKFINHRASIGR